MADMSMLEDGTVLITHRPSRFVLEQPTYGAWLRFLLSRDAATAFTQAGREIIKTIDRQPVRLVDGAAKVKCIACGMLASTMDMSKITIGALVRMPNEEQTGPNEITHKTVLRPVSKTGLGCGACQVLFQAAVRATAEENAGRERYAVALARLDDAVAQCDAPAVRKPCEKHPSMGGFCACLRSHHVSVSHRPEIVKQKGTSKLTPWINVFDPTNGLVAKEQ